jgi:hypothetical protein
MLNALHIKENKVNLIHNFYCRPPQNQAGAVFLYRAAAAGVPLQEAA